LFVVRHPYLHFASVPSIKETVLLSKSPDLPFHDGMKDGASPRTCSISIILSRIECPLWTICLLIPHRMP
jgi:hypothetical protein